ncbi:MAG: hypothetical protein R3240_09440, partial [Gammaproteobacteria bacterium]|nr:hypothetical protein [Gammaproteobacteria bacterium]
SMVVSTEYGVLTPYFKATYVLEFNKDDELVQAYFINDPSKTRMTFEAQTQDPGFFKTTYGSSMVLPYGVLGFAQLELTHMVKDYSQYTITLGVRKEL